MAISFSKRRTAIQFFRGAAMSSNQHTDATTTEETDSVEQTQKSFEYRKGMKSQTMFADNRVLHGSDVNLLPEGATVIKSVYESTYEQVSYIVQHDYEMIIYKDKDGNMRKGYFPKISAETKNEAVIDRFPGSHASCSLLANLVFNKYHMNTPVYREMVRLLNNKMNVSRNTIYNWFVKGSDQLKKVLPVPKEKLLLRQLHLHVALSLRHADLRLHLHPRSHEVIKIKIYQIPW